VELYGLAIGTRGWVYHIRGEFAMWISSGVERLYPVKDLAREFTSARRRKMTAKTARWERQPGVRGGKGKSRV